MEFKLLDEIEIISFCFNNLKETVFILYQNKSNNKNIQPNNLSLIEQDILHKIIYKRFKLLQRDECNIINKYYEKYPNNSYEGYSLFFWQESEKLLLIYPYGYIIIYDYKTTDIIYHCQYPGLKFLSSSTFKHPFKVTTEQYLKYFSLRNIIGSPIENCLFLTGDNIYFIYCLDYSLINNYNIKIDDLFSNRIKIPRHTKIYDIIAHPIEKFLYVGFSDGIVRIYDYNNLRKIKELTNNLIDKTDNKNNKDNNNIIEKENDPVISLDINTIGSYLLEGTERGNYFLWDAFLANKNKKILYKRDIQKEGIFSLKFIKTKQFGNIQKFICLSKKGTIFIYFIIAKDDSVDQPEGRKKPLIEMVYKNNIYDNLKMPNDILKYNIILNSLINISYNNNIISISWPKFVEISDEEKINKNECTLIYQGLISKIFYFYSSIYPKVNYPAAIQLKNRFYETYIPVEGQPNFENKIYYADNYNIYMHDISSSRHRKLVSYSKELRTKNFYLLKFDVKDMITRTIFFILVETGLHRNNLIIADFDHSNNTYNKPKIIYNINDFVILGNSYLNSNSDYAFLLGRDMITGYILQINTGELETIQIGNNIIRSYHSPFNQGYCIIYRTTNNEIKFTQNFTPEIEPPNNIENGLLNNIDNKNNNFNYSNLFNFKCGDLVCFQLDKNEIIIDILFNKTSDYYFCAVSMIDKINIYNREMKLISSLKINFKESPYIISSLIFLDCTLIYSKNDSISYFYPYDNINQLIFRNNRKPIFISGILPDRYIIVSQTANSNISISDITSPMINPLEPILIGYLDSPNINYDLVKQCVVNMFTNQISQHLIDKFINKNLKEIAWLFIDDDKSSFQNMEIKMDLINENYKFDEVIENILVNRNLNNKLELDDIIWKLNYDDNYQYIKDLLIKELKLLIEYGQYNSALKILELIGDYPTAINLLLISTSLEDFEKLRIKFEAKEALNFTDNLLIKNLFNFKLPEKDNIEDNKDNKENNNNIINEKDINNYFNVNLNELQNNNEDKMQFYHKVFDNYEGEHFFFGANFNKIDINFIEDIQKIMEEKNSSKPKGFDAGIQKRVINFGEKPFNIYTNEYNISKKENQILEIYALILQKIENYYGIINHLSKNEKERQNRKMTFYNYNLSLDKLSSSQSFSDENDINSDFRKKNINIDSLEDSDMDINEYLDDLSEDLYLSAYYHCDRGNGEILEDITQNENNATIKCIYNSIDKKDKKNPKKEKKDKKDKNEENNEEDEMKNIWSEVLDENRPLEYEDKWGRRSQPAHSIIFTKNLKTKIIINNSNLLQSIEDRYTIEFWIKLKDINDINIITRDGFSLDINQGLFKLNFRGQEIPQNITKEYSLPLNTFIHIAILYKKSVKNIILLLNCEEILKFNIELSGIENNNPLIFGNERLEAEITEIRIWNKRIPISFIKENYKSPLAILAENKGKLKMNINVKQKKTNYRSESIFIFGNNNKDKKIENSTNDEISFFSTKTLRGNININLESEINNKINNNFENTFTEEEYPSIEDVNSNIGNIDMSLSYQNSSNSLFHQVKDFVFDK